MGKIQTNHFNCITSKPNLLPHFFYKQTKQTPTIFPKREVLLHPNSSWLSLLATSARSSSPSSSPPSESSSSAAAAPTSSSTSSSPSSVTSPESSTLCTSS